jgi:tetratricopeptide (TPR) repeat protein
MGVCMAGTWTWTRNEEQLMSKFDRALELRDDGRLSEALEILASLLWRLMPEDKKLLLHTHLQMGHIHRALGDNAKREAHFRIASEVAPRYELASLSFFHALWSLDRMVEALQEAIRFLRGKDSAEYRELFSIPYCDGLPIPERQLALQARELLAGHQRVRDEPN